MLKAFPTGFFTAVAIVFAINGDWTVWVVAMFAAFYFVRRV